MNNADIKNKKNLIKNSVWHQKISQHYFSINIETKKTALRAYLKTAELENISLILCGSDAILYERTKAHVSNLTHESYLITIPMLDEAASTQRGVEKTFKKNEMFIERTHEPFIFSQRGQNLLITLEIDGRLIRDHIRNIDSYCGIGFDVSQGYGCIFKDMLRSIIRNSISFSPEEKSAISRHIIQHFGLVVRNDIGAICKDSKTVRSSHLMRIENYISLNFFKQDLSPASVALSCGISVRYLHSLFSETGTTAGHCIKNQRLISAKSIINENPHVKLEEVAIRCGLRDHASFTRQFKSEFGITPSEFRAQNHSYIFEKKI